MTDKQKQETFYTLVDRVRTYNNAIKNYKMHKTDFAFYQYSTAADILRGFDLALYVSGVDCKIVWNNEDETVTRVVFCGLNADFPEA